MKDKNKDVQWRVKYEVIIRDKVQFSEGQRKEQTVRSEVKLSSIAKVNEGQKQGRPMEGKNEVIVRDKVQFSEG